MRTSYYFEQMHVKRILLIIFGLSLSIFSTANEIDSLKRSARIETDARVLGNIYGRLGWLHIVSDPLTAEAYIDTALLNYQSINDTAGMADTWYRYGVLNRFVGNYQEAADYMNQNLRYYQSKNDTQRVINSMYQKGVIYSLQGRYNKSLAAYFSILDSYQQLRDSTSMGFTLNSIGIVLKNMENYEEAEDAFLRSIQIHKSLDDEENLANAFGNLGSLYSMKGEFNLAMDNYQKAKEIDKRLGILWGEAINDMNIGHSLMELGRYDEALAHLLAAEEVQQSNEYLADLAETRANLGHAYFQLSQNSEAQKTLEAGLLIKEKSMRVHGDLLEGLAMVYEAQGNFASAAETRKELLSIRDSIYRESNSKLANALAAEYGLDQKERQLAGKDRVIEEQVDAIGKFKRERLLAIGVGGLAICLVLVLILLYVQQKRIKKRDIQNLVKQKEIASLEAYIHGEENERTRIARDLHDGLNGDLSVIKYKVSSLDDSNMNGEAEKTKEAIELIDKACEQVRSISHNLAPSILNDFNLTEAMLQYVASISASSGIDISFQHFGGLISLSKEKETVVFRMVQEMINNIVKHSGATEALVQLNSHDNDLVITVEDNGKGFDYKTEKAGMGLKTIESRVAYLDAEYELNSSGEGTTYTVTIPKTEHQEV
ncbi:MAG: sensor histidine kinase [Bacteroidota bacterium]